MTFSFADALRVLGFVKTPADSGVSEFPDRPSLGIRENRCEARAGGDTIGPTSLVIKIYNAKPGFLAEVSGFPPVVGTEAQRIQRQLALARGAVACLAPGAKFTDWATCSDDEIAVWFME